MKVVPVTVHGSKGSVHTHALLDDGSTVTLIAAALADQVGLHGEPATMRARGAWDSELVCNTEIVKFDVSNSERKKFNVTARKIKELNLPTQCMSSIDINDYKNLDSKFNICKCNAQPMLLIGQDNYDLIAPSVCIKPCKSGEPYLTKTLLGWCMHGNVNNNNNIADRFITHLCCAESCPNSPSADRAQCARGASGDSADNADDHASCSLAPIDPILLSSSHSPCSLNTDSIDYTGQQKK